MPPPNDNDARLERIEKSLDEVRLALLGNMGMPGVVQLVREHEEWKQLTLREKSYQKGAIAVISVVAGVAGSLFSKLFLSGS